MSKLFFTLAFAIGLAVVAWIGAGFVGSDLLALAFTALIGAVYCLGFGELVNLPINPRTERTGSSVT